MGVRRSYLVCVSHSIVSKYWWS